MDRKELIEMLYNKYQKHLLNKEETAKELNISQGTLDNMRRTGAISGKKVSAQIMFPLNEIARYIGE